MQKASKLLPSWLTLTPAPAPAPASANADTCPSPADFQPLEDEHGPDLPEKGEDSCRRLNCFSSSLWMLSGISGEGDRQAGGQDIRAFFADKPPAAPLWLAPAFESRLPSAPPRQPYQHFARASNSSQGNPPQRHRLFARTSELTQKSVTARNHRRVRRLLRELITELPLSATGSAGSHGPARLRGAQSLSTHHTLTTCAKLEVAASNLRPTSASATTADDFRSIAVQAQTMVNKASKACFECRRRGCTVAPSEKWMGGARALRDSHVRLVVRQLRHIELLNRAIDGAGPNAAHDASVKYDASTKDDASAEDDVSEICADSLAPSWPNTHPNNFVL